jgi:NAD(P)-dependent dehydrogenase (short-subunit alcohol dehydrogenase family)
MTGTVPGVDPWSGERVRVPTTDGLHLGAVVYRGPGADALATALDTLRAEGVEADGLPLDVTDREAYARVADRVEDAYGEPPQLLFHTAGVFAMGSTEAGIERDELYIIPYPDAAAPLKAHFEEVIAAVPAEATDLEGVARRAPEVRSRPTTSGERR